MGKDFSRMVEWALGSGALLIPGYAIAGDTSVPPPGASEVVPEPADPVTHASAPRIESAHLDATGVTIRFSEPLRSPASVDPDKFRLTFAYHAKSRPGDYSYYHEYYAASRRVTSYEDIGTRVLENSIEHPSPEALHIPASAALDLSSICAQVTESSESREDAGVYLHYDKGGAPRVESARGVAVESVAPYWLEGVSRHGVPGALRAKPIPVTVACPAGVETDDGADRHRH